MDALLDGLEGGERAARLRLIQRLLDDGCAPEELRAANAAGRLALLPVERLLAQRRQHSIRTGMEAAAVTEDFAVRNHRSIGLHPLDVVQGEAVLNLEGDVSAPDVTIAFADLAGFTALSDEASIEELGRVAGRFEDLVTDVAAPPVRLVKVLGDGAMLVCAEPDPLVRSMLDLVDAAAAEEYLPPVHAGVAHGPALHSAGDWLGRTVWEDAGAYDLRGISEPVPALRAGTPPSRSSAAPRDHPRPPSARSR